MKRFVRPALRAAGTTALAAPVPAFAHPGHGGHGFVAGFVHPFTGMDHLLAMLMVGMLAVLAFPRRWWVCPLAFMAFMLAGFGWGASGGQFAWAEALIVASLAGLGAALFFGVRPPLAAAAGTIGLFAVGHGFAHGAEMPSDGTVAAFAAGFTLATAMLHAIGMALGRASLRLRRRTLDRAFGLAAMASAVAFAWAA